MKNMGDYHNHYLKKDVLLFADVFEKLIDTCLKFYKLSSPGLSWNAMLKMIGVKLENISDIDMYFFIEKGFKGRISYIAIGYAKANDKNTKDYNATKPSIYIPYRDINNLYGWVMSSYLSSDGFEWLKNVNNLDINSISEKSPIG